MLGEECLVGGHKQHTTVCNQFYECLDSDTGPKWMLKYCEEGLIYNPTFGLCVLPGKAFLSKKCNIVVYGVCFQKFIYFLHSPDIFLHSVGTSSHSPELSFSHGPLDCLCQILLESV